jgi:hypothetical protein
MNLNFTGSSWFPAWKFTKSNCHRDFMLGVAKKGGRDYLDGSYVAPYTTVFWNRSLGNISIAYETYRRAVDGNDEEMTRKLKSIGLPLDIRL